MTFIEFKGLYIDNLQGYLPIYISADEEYDEEGKMLLIVELIAPFRMSDGPSRFYRKIEVPVNKEEYLQIKQYALDAGDKWKNELITNVDNCNVYSQTKFID